MVDSALLGARIASGVAAPLVRKLFVQNQPGAGLVSEPVRISALVSFRREKRSVTPKDVARVAEELVRRALKSAGPGERPVEAAEAAAVKKALGDTLTELGDIRIEDYEAVALGPDSFARMLRRRVPLPEYGLSADGEVFYERLLHTASLHILTFFTQRSTYIARQQTVQSQQLARLVQAVDVLLERLPSQSAEDAGFEERYADHIAERYGTLTIYGLDTGTSEWSLDTAYLSLEATQERCGQGGLHLPAEQALAKHDQVLLRGVAGSGKTTLVQWLAVTTASRRYEHGLAHLIGRVPFVLPMRRIVRPGTGFPTPADFLKAVGCPVAGEQPDGWVERVLRARRGVLLVDGIDETAGERRDAAWRWLRELARTFRGNLWLVTSRPSAVREKWLETEDFSDLTLSAMGRDDITTFVRRWHRAAGADEVVEASLLRYVRSTSELNRLATNPLMCGMLCALHRDRRGFLPQDRKSLYEAALTMLLERRDRERELPPPDGERIPYATQVQLLQKLAWWLIRNSRSEMDRSDALHIIGQALPAMKLNGSAEDIYRSLLLRSGLLREPAEGRVDFIHRTFQDYLGSRLAVQDLDFDLLVNNAEEDEWEDVIRLAIAHARPKEAEQMLYRLASQDTSRGKLLAAAGLPYAAEVEPSVRKLVEDEMSSLIPPRTNEQVGRLAALGGDLVLSLLPEPDSVDAADAVHVVSTALLLCTDPALHYLTRFRDHPSTLVQTTLAQGWNLYDRETYAHEILAHLDAQVPIPVKSADDLRALRDLGGRSHVMVHGAYRVEDLTGLLVTDRLAHLDLDAPHPVEGLSWLAAFPNLRTVSVSTAVSESVSRQVPPGVRLTALSRPTM